MSTLVQYLLSNPTNALLDFFSSSIIIALTNVFILNKFKGSNIKKIVQFDYKIKIEQVNF